MCIKPQKYLRGQVWWVNYTDQVERGVIAKSRPCLIISNDDINGSNGNGLVVIPITTSQNNYMDVKYQFTFGDGPKFLLLNQIKTVSIDSISNYYYTFPESMVEDILKSLMGVFTNNPIYNENVIQPMREVAATKTATKPITRATVQISNNPDFELEPETRKKPVLSVVKPKKTRSFKLSDEQAKQFVIDCDNNMSLKKIKEKYDISTNTVYTYYKILTGKDRKVDLSQLEKPIVRLNLTDEEKSQFLKDYDTLDIDEVREKYGLGSTQSVSTRAWRYKKEFEQKLIKSLSAKQSLTITLDENTISSVEKVKKPDHHEPKEIINGVEWYESTKKSFVVDSGKLNTVDLMYKYDLKSSKEIPELLQRFKEFNFIM